jgi:tetraacyldisaccharide 4'-kinase
VHSIAEIRRQHGRDVMSLDTAYRSLVSGQWKGPLAAALRGGLGLLERPYGWIVQRRNERFDRNANQAQRVAAPVISVGNITVGGTGKTPFVAWLAGWFQDRQRAITIISRGYGSESGRPNDEALELAARLPGVPHVQNPDRVAAARAALAANPQQVLILDDAFQHRRLARDLDIVLLDALEPFGYERLLPRGLLREPPENLARAHIIALSRSDAVSEPRRRELEARARGLAPQAIWLELTHRPVGLVSSDGGSLEWTELRNTRVAAFCGIGNPQGFRHTLSDCGLNVAGWLELPDHCAYGKREVAHLQKWLATQDVEHAICTRKDLVKIPRVELAGKRLWALDIDLAIVRGQTELEREMERLAGQVARLSAL